MMLLFLPEIERPGLVLLVETILQPEDKNIHA